MRGIIRNGTRRSLGELHGGDPNTHNIAKLIACLLSSERNVEGRSWKGSCHSRRGQKGFMLKLIHVTGSEDCWRFQRGSESMEGVEHQGVGAGNRKGPQAAPIGFHHSQ